MTNKLLIVYNIAEIKRKRDNSENYRNIINTLRFQTIINDCHVVISGCRITDKTKNYLMSQFGDSISYNWIEDAIPVNVTFNHSVLKAIEKFGEFDGYLYLDSGTIIETAKGLELIHSKLKDDVGILSIISDADSGLAWWFGIKDDDIEGRKRLFNSGDLRIPLGSAVNGICYVFSKKFQQYYGKLIPDIFAGYCVESTYTFLCSAIHTRWYVTNEIKIKHWHAMEGGSQCSDPIGWKATGNKDYDHPFIVPSILQRVDNRVAKFLGLGYEECQQVVMHNKDAYDENGFAKNEDLKTYIKHNLYLKDFEFNYNKIDNQWI